MCHVPFSGQEVKGQGYTQMVNIFAVGAGGILVDHWSTISSFLLHWYAPWVFFEVVNVLSCSPFMFENTENIQLNDG